MSDKTTSTVQIDPLAAALEASALNDFYKNRNLLLANEVASLRGQVEALKAELALRADNNDRLQSDEKPEGA